MLGMLGYELAFFKVEVGVAFVIDVFDPETKKAGEVQREEKREVSEDAAFGGIEVKKGIFDEIKQFGVWFGLPNTFLQELHHEEGDRILQYVEEDMLIEYAPFEFADALKILEVVMVDDQIEDGGGLEEIGLAGPLSAGCPDAIDKVGLDTEELGIDCDDKARFAVFHPFEDDSFGLV